MRRVRLLIYDGPEKNIQMIKSLEAIRESESPNMGGVVITSRELDSKEITLFECKENEEDWNEDRKRGDW